MYRNKHNGYINDFG